jgi:hypothetical protein
MPPPPPQQQQQQHQPPRPAAVQQPSIPPNVYLRISDPFVQHTIEVCALHDTNQSAIYNDIDRFITRHASVKLFVNDGNNRVSECKHMRLSRLFACRSSNYMRQYCHTLMIITTKLFMPTNFVCRIACNKHTKHTQRERERERKKTIALLTFLCRAKLVVRYLSTFWIA